MASRQLLFSIVLILVLVASTSGVCAQDSPETIELTEPETALISGFRSKWDTPQPGKLLLDGVHRSLLVRFPDAATKVAAKLRDGYRIKKAELLLPFDGTDFGKGFYQLRTSFGGAKLYKNRKPRWHAVARALKEPWAADPERGPTFNSYINGAGFWEKYGAQGDDDRFKHEFGPVEVSYYQAWDKPDPVLDNADLEDSSPLKRPPEEIEAEGNTPGAPLQMDGGDDDAVPGLEEETIDPARMDVTASLRDPAFGTTMGDRLRRLSDCGFLLKKWETYDWRYRVKGQGAYEWQVAVGGGAIHIKQPRLLVTFERDDGAPAEVDLPPAADVASLVKKLDRNGAGGEPTAVLPDEKRLNKIIQENKIQRADWMTDWQWKRVQELNELGGGYRMPESREKYLRWIDGMLNDPPRYWNGWDVHDRLLTYYLYRDALPQPVREHYFQNYWDAWLMCWRPTDTMDHPQAVEIRYDGKNKYYQRTGDWRGNASFYRDGYCYQMGTMNFNHTSAMGAMLAGDFTGCDRAVRDGRHGLEHWPLRTWCWYDGSTQESIDHYYFAITLSGQKMFADFGPTQLDRLMGKSILAKSVGEVTSAFHPALRHFVASSGRTNTQHVLLTQDGLQHIVHTLSDEGALHDTENGNIPDSLRVIGKDVPPGRVAQQTAQGPWAPGWVSKMVDQKPFPFEMTCAYTEWGHHRNHPLWRRTYLGENYGLGSADLHWGVVQALGQWRRNPEKPVTRLQEMGMFMIRCGVNETRLVNSHSGWMPSEGNLAVFQQANKMIAVGSPYRMEHGKMGAYINTQNEKKKVELEPGEKVEQPAGPRLKTAQTTVGFFNYQDPRTWKIYVDGEPVEQLPCTAEQGQRITIHDGASYIGLIPLPGGPPANTSKVVIKRGKEQRGYPRDVRITPALVIDSYSYHVPEKAGSDAEDKLDALIDEGGGSPDEGGPNMEELDHSYSGFVVEMGDEDEYGSFERFQRYLAEGQLSTRWEPEASTVHVAWESGDTTLETGVKTDYKQGKASPQCWAYRRVNGEWPYLPDALDRDTTLAQQGRRARLKKGGAELTTEPGRMAFLQTEPVSGTYCGWNPLPDMTLFRMITPEGIRLETDGRTGLTRLIVQPKRNRIELNHALKAGQKNRGDLARALLVFGLDEQPTVVRNGQKIFPTPAAEPPVVTRKKINGESAWIIPLMEDAAGADLEGLGARYQRAKSIFNMILAGEKPEVADTVVQDWWLSGPFPNKDKKGFSTPYPPEKEVDLDATYTGAQGKEFGWKRTQPPGKPPLGKGSINLKGQFKPNGNVCAYAYTEITSDEERDATLYVGSDDTITVWINGEKVLSREVYRGANLDQDQVPVHLKKGTNQVLVKVCQTFGGWEFYFRLGDAYGVPLTEGVECGAPPRE